eukprot:CAMPEP_0179336896 /NCGR_PEP_ID=MMETSP0797-20121207/67309_1 /TAXON_ID=47934 /ORGANISM="Dinophysis acuminata, Strain DAEP01" /LENGTH=558 /DNA_ID=CAMNT_0021050457 /DNA_START=65 /DNA_END=1741 /DNA_ORIENTATION=+
MAPKKKAPPPAAPPALKKAKKAVVTWQCKFGDEWKDFDSKDMAMLEARYQGGGAKSKFITKEFTFNQGFETRYEVNFEKMTQKNLDTKKARELRRKDDSPSSSTAQWEWWNDADWSPYVKEDGALIEKAFKTGINPFMTKDLSFNKGYGSLYIYDFDVMTQVNSDSGTSRKIQRTEAGGSKVFGHTKGEDDGYADVLLGGKDSDAAAGAAAGVDFDLGLPAALVAAQRKRGAQSCRKQKRDYGPIVTKDKHGAECFDEMLKNEKEFCGEWVVFYHSYSCAAILYEVQAAVGSVLFRFKAEFAGLPRILAHGFKHIPDAPTMLKEFPKWKDQDHNPAFKAVGLCATSSLLAHDSEAPAKSVFLMGYSVGSLKGVLEKLLGAVGVPKPKVAKLAADIIELAAEHGLDTSGVPGGKKCKSGRSGHMLQIFLRRELIDKYVYPAFPFGVPDKKRDLPLSKYLAEGEPIEGQVRITFNPDVFLRATYARMFTFSADPTYHKNRPDFIRDLVGLLEPILKDEAVRTKAAKGIFGGKPPDWWTPEDQSDKAAMPAARYMASAMDE